MQDYFRLVSLKISPRKNHVKNLFETARYCFVHRKFSEALRLMEAARESCPEKFLPAVQLNMALFHHVLGNQDAARKLYELTDETSEKLINYAAFCHRYFLYSKFRGGEIHKDDPLQPIYRHNKLNFRLSTEGISAAHMQRGGNIFDERLWNDFYSKTNRPQENFFRNLLADEVSSAAEKFPKNFLLAKKNHVGIYVNDIQRHKDTAFVYDLIEIFKELGCRVYVYFDNLFTNKLVNLLPNEIIFRNVVNLGVLGFNNLVANDRINFLLDLTGNKLRTRLTTFPARGKNCMTLDEIFLDTPLCLQSEIYFGESVVRNEKVDGVAIIGDLKFISDDEISCIKEMIRDRQLIFMSFAFCDELCRENFSRRLVELGINRSRCTVIAGVLPFKKYLSFLASASSVVVTSAASVAEISEAIFVGAPVILLAQNPRLHKISKTFGLNYGAITTSSRTGVRKILKEMRATFTEKMRERLEKLPLQSACEYLFDEDLRLQYRNGNFTAEVNMSCNGDLLIFSEPRDDED